MAMHETPPLRESGRQLSYTSGVTRTIDPVSDSDEGSAWELYAILDTLRELDGTNRDAVLATAVHVAGSSYRHPGARLLLVRDGRRIGYVVDPQFETEIAKQAWWLTEARIPVVRDFGAAKIVLERTDTPEFAQTVEFLEAHRRSRKPAVVATAIAVENIRNVRIGDRLLMDESWARCGALAGSILEAQVLTHASAALREKKSRLARLGQADLFVEWVGPPLSLLVLGAGRDTLPLLCFATQLGWDVTVSDGEERSDPFASTSIGADSAVVLMTHNYGLDAFWLRRIMPLRPGYLGLLGPKARAEKLFAEIGISPGPNMHAPAGLDIGGDSPEIVALSIVSEIQAKMSHRAGGMLKRRAGAIHSAVLEKGLTGEEIPATPVMVSHARQG